MTPPKWEPAPPAVGTGGDVDVPVPFDGPHRCVALYPVASTWVATCACGWSTDGHGSTADAADAYGHHVFAVGVHVVQAAIGRLATFYGVAPD